jgi:hypothetical protein
MVEDTGEGRWLDVELTVGIQMMPQGRDQIGCKHLPQFKSYKFVGVPPSKIATDVRPKQSATVTAVVHQLRGHTGHMIISHERKRGQILVVRILKSARPFLTSFFEA